ncbi:MAG: outer membrane receptor for ferrienterochelin and colicins [Bacteroidia bacterium]|jgi:outer membrane receptor for ferrienterochelin and colicins
MKQWILIGIFLGICTSTQAQFRQIEGFVIDEQNKKPVSDAVILDGDSINNFVITDSLGRFSVLTAAKQLEIKHISYKTEIINTSGFINGSRITIESGHTTVLDQTVVGSDKIGRALKNQIVSVESVSPSLIINKNPVTVDEILNQVSGVVISDGQISIRNGAGWSYGAGTRALVVVDGMPLISGDAGQVQWNFIATDNIRNMEVVKGASSVLYGSAALNGMINIRSAWPGQKPQTKVTFFSGKYSDASRSTLDWSSKSLYSSGLRITDLRSKGKHDVVTTFEYIDDQGYRFGDFDKRLHGGLDYRYKLNKNIELGIRTHLLSTNNGSFLLWKSYDSAYNALDDQTTETNGLKYRVDPFISIRTKNGWQHHFKSRLLSINNQVDNGDTSVDQSNKSKMYYADYQTTYPINKKGDLIFGATVISTITNSPLFTGTQKANNQALYGQLNQKWKKLTYSVGIRYENYALNDFKESKPVFRAGMNYGLAKATYIRASYGQGYRFPTIGESYIKTTVGAISIYPNNNLQSETGDNIEIGLKQGFKLKNIKGYFDVALFQMSYQNMMEFTFGQWSSDVSADNGYGLGFKSLNTGPTSIKGIDLSLVGQVRILKGSLRAFGGYTSSLPVADDVRYKFATDSVGNDLSYSTTSSDTTNGILKYRSLRTFKMDLSFSRKRLQFGVSWRYQSQMQNIDKAFVDPLFAFFVPGIQTGLDLNPKGYWITDLRVSYRISSKLKMALIINNNSNIEYMVRPADIGAPRMAMLQLRMTL